MDYCSFRIDFQDGDDSLSWEITAKNKFEAAEIVAKISYLNKKSDKSNMLAELARRTRA